MINYDKKLAEVNQSGLYGSVSFILPQPGEFYSDGIIAECFDVTRRVSNNFAAIRDDRQTCRFLSEVLEYNLEAGFEDLAKTSLELQVLGWEKEISWMTFNKKTHVGQSGYQSVVTMCQTSGLLHSASLNRREAVTSHEIGHALIIAATSGNKTPGRSGLYTSNVEENWRLETDADALSIASNPDNTEITSKPVDSRWYKSLYSRAYQKKVISDETASYLSKYCVNRNKVIGEVLREMPGPIARTSHFLLNIFDMRISPTHPPDIYRMVKATEFQKKMQDFRSKNKI